MRTSVAGIDITIVRSVQLALWINQWAQNNCSTDAFIAGTANATTSVTSEAVRSNLLEWLTANGIRPTQPSPARPVFPAAGDLAGTPGPRKFQLEAVRSGQLVAFDEANVALLPLSDVTDAWRAFAVESAPGARNIARPETSSTDMREGLHDALAALTQLPPRDGYRDELTMAFQQMQVIIDSLEWPPNTSGPTRETVGRALFVLWACQLATSDSSPIAPSPAARAALVTVRELAARARRSLSAACMAR